MKHKSLWTMNLAKRPVKNWLRYFGVTLNEKTGGQYHKMKNENFDKFVIVQPELFMQAFHNVEVGDGTIMFK